MNSRVLRLKISVLHHFQPVVFLFRDFESVLTVIKWPYLSSISTELINPTKDSLNKLMSAAEYLFLVIIIIYRLLSHIMWNEKEKMEKWTKLLFLVKIVWIGFSTMTKHVVFHSNPSKVCHFSHSTRPTSTKKRSSGSVFNCYLIWFILSNRLFWSHG